MAKQKERTKQTEKTKHAHTLQGKYKVIKHVTHHNQQNKQGPFTGTITPYDLSPQAIHYLDCKSQLSSPLVNQKQGNKDGTPSVPHGVGENK